VVVQDDQPLLQDFMDVQVLVQLQTMSLVDVTLLQSRGFPVHLTFAEFAKRCGSLLGTKYQHYCYRYGALLLGTEHTIEGTDEEICYKIIANARLDGWCTGKSQVSYSDCITVCICNSNIPYKD